MPIGRMSSGDMCSSFSPRERSGPMAASLARAVISEPEKPVSAQPINSVVVFRAPNPQAEEYIVGVRTDGEQPHR